MSISTLLSSFEQNVKIKPWLQFVGYMVAFGGLVSKHPLIAYVGLGISMAGWLYTKIYP
jgi:hypothetical protein